MKKYIYFPLLFLVGCTSINSTPNDEKQNVELSLNKVRTELEDIKHDMNTYEIEQHILEGKLSDQEQSISALQTDTIERYSAKLDSLISDLETAKTQLESMQKKQKQMLGDIAQLSHHANDTTSALTQYKGRIESIEKVVAKQSHNFMHDYAEAELKRYVVKSGDTLEKIAQLFHTSPAEIKRVNKRSNDLIIVGEELKVPKGGE